VRRSTAESAQSQLDAFLNKYSREIRELACTAIDRLRRLLPGAVEMVYDNYNALVIGFGPTERPSEAIISIALYPRWINLFFLNGVALTDPGKILKGSGKHVRHVVLTDAAVLEQPDIVKLIRESTRLADPPFRKRNSRQLIIKSISAKQRPRKPPVTLKAKTNR
jgi:hypothetical protein